jgi:hypothetical protein
MGVVYYHLMDKFRELLSRIGAKYDQYLDVS